MKKMNSILLLTLFALGGCTVSEDPPQEKVIIERRVIHKPAPQAESEEEDSDDLTDFETQAVSQHEADQSAALSDPSVSKIISRPVSMYSIVPSEGEPFHMAIFYDAYVQGKTFWGDARVYKDTKDGDSLESSVYETSDPDEMSILENNERDVIVDYLKNTYGSDVTVVEFSDSDQGN